VNLEEQKQKIDKQGKKIDDLQQGLQILQAKQINSHKGWIFNKMELMTI
jgi:hypothetical protein